MFTRRTATVTMSAPEASCACAITACDEYLPVPTISRDRNVRPAMVKGVSVMSPVSHGRAIALSAADEIHDLDLSPSPTSVGKAWRFRIDEIVLDGNAPRIDVELRQQLRTDTAGRARRVPR